MSRPAMAFEANPVLFGHGEKPGLLAVELTDDRHIRLYHQDGWEDVPFSPYLWLISPDLLQGTKVPHRLEELSGTSAYRVLAWFDSWADLNAARRHISKVVKAQGLKGETNLFLNDPVQQYLTLSGQTLFKGLRFGDLRRLQLHLEIDCGEADFSHDQPHRASLALGQDVFELTPETEREELERVAQRIREVDPDVIEGHDLFRQHLPYLQERARRLGMKLAWGRDGRPAT
ncbi:MAG TPA: DNA polymerase II, partial [Candidatus Xenobia bacterium]